MDEQDRVEFLEKHGLAANSWIYGSPCRPLHASWFRVEGAALFQVSAQETGNYTYVVTRERLNGSYLAMYELLLVSRPAR